MSRKLDFGMFSFSGHPANKLPEFAKMNDGEVESVVFGATTPQLFVTVEGLTMMRKSGVAVKTSRRPGGSPAFYGHRQKNPAVDCNIVHEFSRQCKTRRHVEEIASKESQQDLYIK